MTLEPGQKAPSFSLEDDAGRRVKLADLSGRWTVLYFYPKDDTPGCTAEACEFTAGMKAFEALGAQVFGVSPDTPASHAKFRAKHGLTVGLLSDPGKAMLAAYGAWGMKTLYGRKFEGVIRSTVILDPQGRVAHRWKTVRAKGHAEQVRKKLAELRGEENG